jgi:hypothetical protein
MRVADVFWIIVIIGIIVLFTCCIGCSSSKPKRIDELCWMRADGVVICPDQDKK